MNLARMGNKYLADEEPWKVVKENPERASTILYVGLQVAAALSVLSEPFLPFTAAKLKKMLRLDPDVAPGWKSLMTDQVLLPQGHRIGNSELLFRKIEDAEIQAQLDKLENTKKENAMSDTSVTPQKDTIVYEDFAKMDLRVGTILEAEKMPKAKKLIVMKVDTGIDTRTIVSGIAEYFSPEDLIGKKVTVLVNLAPRPLRGVDSQGMILLAENPDGSLIFVGPEEGSTPNGAPIT
jgi:methionyl-tRNA synthetase